MSLQQLKMLRERAWIQTPLGDQFALHFDDTLYLQLVAEHFYDEIASFSCVNEDEDLYHVGYAEGYNQAIQQLCEHFARRYGQDDGTSKTN